MSTQLFSSESVTEGHPDKICDQVSDAILDAMLAQDPQSRVACETATTTGMVLVMGEITTQATVDIPAIVRKTVKEIGYTDPRYGFDGDSCAVFTTLDKQSPDIALGVDHSLEFRAGDEDAFELNGAGDQGMMFGYACSETDSLMPAPLALSHQMAHKLAEIRKDGTFPWLRPDGKTQVTVEYDENRNGVRTPAIVLSTQHDPEISLKDLREAMIECVIKPTIPAEYLCPETKIYVNPTGRFVVGGPVGDSGITGRKIIVDTYGGAAPHGGGCFSGKDPTKVDRSAAYMARYVAKNLVAAGLATRCQVEVAYAIGVSHPVSVMVDTYGTGKLDDEKLVAIVNREFDLRPAAIIAALDLRRPIYKQVAAYGHFGRPELDLPWERTDRVDALRAYL
ncbi:MAG: methionine adenosyltransferase [Oscillospiraceae bacterium]|nr:methionine adenosyltransferase [Oscillospiraceae bacterium]